MVFDPIQKADLCLCGLDGGADIFELVEPKNESSATYGALKRSGGFHHVCLSVANMSEVEALTSELRVLPVTNWHPAVLFGGRGIRFYYSTNCELIEFLVDEVMNVD